MIFKQLIIDANTGNISEETREFTEEELLAASNATANAYKDKRALEYPSIADQLDTLYHGGYDAWKAEIEAVKIKYPKGGN